MTHHTDKKIVNFLFEIGTLRKLLRMHQQTLLSQDLSDTIATHSYHVAIMAWFLAKMEKADPYKTAMPALLHDTKEIKSNDHNYVHKKYVKIFEEVLLLKRVRAPRKQRGDDFAFRKKGVPLTSQTLPMATSKQYLGNTY